MFLFIFQEPNLKLMLHLLDYTITRLLFAPIYFSYIEGEYTRYLNTDLEILKSFFHLDKLQLGLKL